MSWPWEGGGAMIRWHDDAEQRLVDPSTTNSIRDRFDDLSVVVAMLCVARCDVRRWSAHVCVCVCQLRQGTDRLCLMDPINNLVTVASDPKLTLFSCHWIPRSSLLAKYRRHSIIFLFSAWPRQESLLFRVAFLICLSGSIRWRYVHCQML